MGNSKSQIKKSKSVRYIRDKGKCRVCNQKRKKKVERPNGEKMCVKCYEQFNHMFSQK